MPETLTFPQRMARMQTSPSRCCWCDQPLYRMPTLGGEGWEPWMCWTDQPRDDGTPACWDRQVAYGIRATHLRRDGGQTPRWSWLFAPTPRQAQFAEMTRRTKYSLFGGAKAVAKSYGLRWLLYRDCLRIPGLRCLLLRRTYGELESTHLLEMPSEAEKLKAVGAGTVYTSGNRELRFGNDSLIRAGHCETDIDVAKFLSTQWDRIVFDEVVTFPLAMFLPIVSCARTAKQDVIDDGGGQVWGGTNPGGRGARWVHEYFVTHDVDREQFPDYDASQWGFVQGRLEDNPYIEPGYRKTLMNLPPILRRQWLEGDWGAFEGQYFDFMAFKGQQPWHVCDAGLTA